MGPSSSRSPRVGFTTVKRAAGFTVAVIRRACLPGPTGPRPSSDPFSPATGGEGSGFGGKPPAFGGDIDDGIPPDFQSAEWQRRNCGRNVPKVIGLCVPPGDMAPNSFATSVRGVAPVIVEAVGRAGSAHPPIKFGLGWGPVLGGIMDIGRCPRSAAAGGEFQPIACDGGLDAGGWLNGETDGGIAGGGPEGCRVKFGTLPIRLTASIDWALENSQT